MSSHPNVVKQAYSYAEHGKSAAEEFVRVNPYEY